MTDDPFAPRDADDFYVGYLPLPRAHKRFIQIMLPVAVAFMGIGALGIAASQPEWSAGSWDLATPTEYEGTLLADPYPMLVVDGEAHLIVGPAKVAPTTDTLVDAGIDLRVGPKQAVVTGYPLQRDGRKMISLEVSEKDSIRITDQTPRPPVPIVLNTGLTARRGEIMDAKCFMGAMSPGEGRAHKACATLCITSGIPPVLVTRDESGAATYHLLVTTTGDGLSSAELESIKPYIAEPVTIDGTPGSLAGWNVLAIDPEFAVSPL
ncbi:MAG: hypothetical protein AAGI17_09275 [Planctomycetota bacterium]